MTTGHEGFDFWKDEFSAKIKEIEEALHINYVHEIDDDGGGSMRSIADKSTSDLVHQATSLLKNVWIEAKGVSWQKDPALRQEMMDIYKACQMQLETYQTLSDQQEDSMDGKVMTSTERRKSKTSINTANATNTAERTSETDPSLLWDQRYMDNYHQNSKRANIQANTQGRVSQQNSRLKDALRSLRETEEIAQEINGELDKQRATLHSTQSSINAVKDMTQQAKGLLKSMNKKWWMKW